MIPPLIFIPKLDQILGVDIVVQHVTHWVIYMVLQISMVVCWLLLFIISAIDLLIKAIYFVINAVTFVLNIPHWIDQQINLAIQVTFHYFYDIFLSGINYIIWAVSFTPGLANTAGSFAKEQITNLVNGLSTTAQDIGQFIWDVLLLIIYRMWFVIQLIFYAVAFATVWYIGTLVYRFLTHRDFALQGEFYFSPHPPNQQPQGY